jgi:ribosomal protein L37E
MSTAINEQAETKCGYCGRENLEHLSACAGCGYALTRSVRADDLQPKRKDKTLALTLALLLGPLGLLYASFSGGMIMLLVAATVYCTRHGGLWFIIVARIVCVAWAHHAVRKQRALARPPTDPASLLDEAARLEDVDRSKAIAAYHEIVKLFPDTAASREAARNIQTLTSRHEGTA